MCIIPEESDDSSETEQTYCKSKAERKAERAQKREECHRQREATNDELESTQEMDGDHEPRYHHEEEIKTHQDKGKGIDPDELGTLEGIDPWELTPKAQLAEYECLKSTYMWLRNRVNQSTYQEKAESARKRHKNSHKHNKESNEDSLPDSSSDNSDQSCHHSKKRKSSQRKAEKKMRAHHHKGWNHPDTVITINNEYLCKEWKKEKSEKQKKRLTNEYKPSHQICSGNLLATVLGQNKESGSSPSESSNSDSECLK